MLRAEFLEPLGLTQSAFALRLGVSFPRLNELIRGRRSMTPDTALRLAQVLGMPADFWLDLQTDWDLWHAMQGQSMGLPISPLAGEEDFLVEAVNAGVGPTVNVGQRFRVYKIAGVAQR